MKNAALVEEAERVAGGALRRGIEVLFDDRDERPGIKFKDADLVGIPLRVTFGEKNYEAGYAEIRDRKTGETDRVGISAVVDRVCDAVEEKRKECTP